MLLPSIPIRMPNRQPPRISAASTQHPPSDTMPPRPTRRLDAQVIVMESSFSLKASRSSVTRTVKVNVPAVVGVPEMVFSLGSARLMDIRHDTFTQ